MNKQPSQAARGNPTADYVEEGSAYLALAGIEEGAPRKGGPSTQPTLPSPTRITDNAFAFQRLAALRAAVELDVFTAIGEGHDTPANLARRCAASERGMKILCDYLVAIGFLAKEDNRYEAAPDAAAYLDRRSPAFIGDALRFVASPTILKGMLSDPAAVVRKGGTVLDEAETFIAPDQTDWTTYARAVGR